MSVAQMQTHGSVAAVALPIPFPAGRSALYPREFARLICCSKQHVSDLIEEGKLGAFDIASGRDVFPTLIVEIANELKVKPVVIQKALDRACNKLSCSRRYWRIPRSAFEEFLTRNHSRSLFG